MAIFWWNASMLYSLWTKRMKLRGLLHLNLSWCNRFLLSILSSNRDIFGNTFLFGLIFNTVCTRRKHFKGLPMFLQIDIKLMIHANDDHAFWSACWTVFCSLCMWLKTMHSLQRKHTNGQWNVLVWFNIKTMYFKSVSSKSSVFRFPSN